MKTLGVLVVAAALVGCQTTSEVDFDRANREAHMRCSAYDMAGPEYRQCVVLVTEDLYRQFSYDRQRAADRMAIMGGLWLLGQ